jgi:hypothetical protein
MGRPLRTFPCPAQWPYAREVVLAFLRRQPKAPVEADDEQLALF